MGSFLFKWEHPAKEVYVTGTFDDWGRSIKLERNGDRFEKLVKLPESTEKILYKFVVDGEWTTDHTAPQQKDSSNNVNNVLLPENITGPHSTTTPAAAGIMSGVTPQSTTAALAGQVPKEGEKNKRPESAASDLPGSFPETPFHDAEEFAVNPIPASSGFGNPISLKPGEKVPDPSSITTNTIDSTVTTDKASYDKAGEAPPQLPGVVNSPSERDAKDGSFNVPGATGTVIPESSLPMGEGATRSAADPVTIQSAGANSTTAALAGQVPKEPRGQAVDIPKDDEPSKVAQEGAAAGGVAAAAAGAGTAVSSKGDAIAPAVPDTVKESITKAHVSPEAAGDEAVVDEKAAVEQQILKDVPKEDEAGAPAPTATATLTEKAPAATSSDNTAPTKAKDQEPITTKDVPADTPAAKNATNQAAKSGPDSRDISPMTKPTNQQSIPAVTSGVASGSTPTSSSASKNGPSSNPTTAEKKSKRSSGFFNKLKAKFSDKDKK